MEALTGVEGGVVAQGVGALPHGGRDVHHGGGGDVAVHVKDGLLVLVLGLDLSSLEEGKWIIKKVRFGHLVAGVGLEGGVEGELEARHLVVVHSGSQAGDREGARTCF